MGFNSRPKGLIVSLRTGYFPAQWKVSQIITILKPGKPTNEVTSYRPIILLPVLSKLFEKLFLTILQPFLHEQRTIPDHQFGFRQKNDTTLQVHSFTSAITEALENHKYGTAAFLDNSQAFDKVWHEGLICKLRPSFPACTHELLRSYLEHWNIDIFRLNTERLIHLFTKFYPACHKGAYWAPSSISCTLLTYLPRMTALLHLLLMTLSS
jgi:hypothetical protein